MPRGKSLKERLSLSNILQLRDPRRDLSSILEGVDPNAPLNERITWVAHLVDWLRKKGLVEEESAAQKTVRLRFLLQLLDRQPEWRAKLGAVLVSILRDSEAPLLFAQTELSEHHAFFSETMRRIGDKIIPSPPRPGELSYALETIFNEPEDLEWLEAISESDWAHIAELVGRGREYLGIVPDREQGWRRDLEDAVVTISVQAAALGLSSEVRVRLRAANPDQTPTKSFRELNRLAVKWRETSTHEDAEALRVTAAACEAAVSNAFAVIENSGVSLALVYNLEALTAYLRRLDLLLEIVDAHGDEGAPLFTVRDLFIELVRTNIDRRSVRSLLQMNFDLFSRKMVEHAGETGEHYITRTTKEYYEMLKAGAGGGLVTVVTVLAKFAISSVRWPLFLEGMLLWGNYATSFLAMQAFGFALATKQPSMTAAALAGKLSETLDRNRLGEFVELVARITRSQFIAAVGNVGFVIPGAILCDVLFRAVTGHHVISQEYAVKTLENLHPWHSLTVYYAAITGVLLWLSSFGSGWLQNWVVFRRLPEAIAGHPRIRSALGDHRAASLGQWISHNAGGIGGNVTIGFLLAFVPVFGHFVGLPIDVRHVTLSSGQTTFAFCAMDPALLEWHHFAVAALSIALIGTMNFGVSMACALVVAVRARRVRKSWVFEMLAAVRKAMAANPLPFFFPPRT